MSLQACVERLFKLNSNYLHPEQAFNQASSLQTLSNDLYTDPFRFVYELVQNADDAASTHLQIALIDNKYLIVSHNGKTFNEKDVNSLCAVNNSTKIRDSQTAGYKGLGFKAIFGKSDYVLIITNHESFRFDGKFKFEWRWTDIDQETWENKERKFIYPWQICPIWTEEIPDTISTWLSNAKNKMPVSIVIRLHNVAETQTALQELARQPQTFLFLRHIRQLEFIGIPTASTIHIKEKPDGSMSLSYNKNQRSEWLIDRREILVPSEILEDKRLPEKLRHVLSIEIGLAAKLDITNRKRFITVSNNDSILFAYMPTQISTYQLPLLVNANFLTNANREQIHTDSIWNQWLFEQIPRVTIEWVKELIKTPNWSNAAYDLLPIPIKGSDILANMYNESCSSAVINTQFIRNTHGEELAPNEAIIDLTHLSDQQLIGAEPIRRFILHEYNPRPTRIALHPFIPDNPRLRKLGILIFYWENAIDMFNSREFQDNFSIDRNIKLISYLFDKRTDEEISKLLHRIPFIMDRNKRLRIPAHIYFPSQFNDINWNSSDCQESYVHDNLMRKLPLQHRKGLEELGVTVRTDLTFFHRTIIPRASRFITSDNALPTIQRLFHLYFNGQIIANDLKKLGELSLLTNANTLVPANRLYLSAAYQPYLPLDTRLSTQSHLFVSPSYMQNVFSTDWKYFFLLLGVHENIDLVTLNDDCRFFQNYHEDQMKIIFGLKSQQVHKYKYQNTIHFLEFTENNFHFAHFFWQYVIQTINVNHLNHSEIAYWGLPQQRGQIEGSEVNTFPQWFIRTRSCIPVQIISTNDMNQTHECFTAPKVYSNRLSPLIGRYLPIFECTVNAEEPLNDEWLKFFKFKTELSIDDHLFILHQIYIRNQTQVDIEDDQRIQRIYINLLKILSNTDINQRQLYREKCQSKNICFLTERNLFMPPEELNVWLIDTFQSPSELHLLKLDLNNRRHANLSDLLYVLNINKIEDKDLNLIPINANLCHELTDRLQKSYFSLLFDYHKINNKDKLNQLDNIKFYEADGLELYTNHLNIFVGNTQVYKKNNCLYVTKSWNSDLVLNQLSTKICELLDVPIHVFKTHICTLLTISSIDEYFIELKILSSNDQFIKLIQRDNLALFNRLQYLLPSYTPAQLLIAGLEAQNPHWTGYIYHYTHLENAVSILRDQTIKSRHFCQSNNFKDSSAYDFMSQTVDQVNHYIRFYFRPLTLTQLNNENLGSEKSKKRNNYTPMCPVPIFFCINLQAVLNIPNLLWKVSLGNMSKHHTEYDCTLDVIKRLDFCGLFDKFDTERGQHSAQLEFLIENQLNLEDLPKDAITLICQNSDAKESLECILKKESKQIYHFEIKFDYFFGTNNRIFINHDCEQDHISVCIDGKTQRKGEIFIVQIKLNQNEEKIDLACKGNISAAFHSDRITTIYGKEKSIDVFVGKQAYAVYYKYQEQLWLIYTNHDKPKLDYTHIEQHPDFIPYD